MLAISRDMAGKQNHHLSSLEVQVTFVKQEAALQRKACPAMFKGNSSHTNVDHATAVMLHSSLVPIFQFKSWLTDC